LHKSVRPCDDIPEAAVFQTAASHPGRSIGFEHRDSSPFVLETPARDFDRGYELDPSFLHARIGKALSHIINGQPAAAGQFLQATEREFEAREVGDAEGLDELAQAYAVLRDTPAALRVCGTVSKGGFSAIHSHSDPLLESIRRDGKYASLLELARQRHDRFKRRFFGSRLLR
jgi:hypothetical protein